MTEKRCETCKHWEPASRGHGVCRKIGHDGMFDRCPPLAVMGADPIAGCTLFTLPEFGCALHEGKP
jgi:hypothetical protein